MYSTGNLSSGKFFNETLLENPPFRVEILDFDIYYKCQIFGNFIYVKT